MVETNSIVKVSIIVPVYNVEPYLKKALDSVINQTLKEIEIIIVNDGSTDNSLNIIREYEKKDSRIKIINQENKGLSGARNSGLEIAMGKYIYFMDSDDYIDLDTLEICYKKSEEKDLDFVFFDALPFTEDKINIDKQIYNRSKILNSEDIKTGVEYLQELFNYNIYRAPVWLNFIKLSYLKTLNLKFYPKILHEDELFTLILFINAIRVSYIERKFFKRRMRFNSIMTNQKSEKNIIGYLTVIKEMRNYIKLENIEVKTRLLEKRIQDLLGNLITILSLLDSKIIEKYRDILEKEKFVLSKKNKVKLKLIKILRFTYRCRECKKKILK